MTSTTDQIELVQQLVHSVAWSWSKTFDRPELLRYNQLPKRLDGVVHSVLTQLDGDGGVTPHFLAPKVNPTFDLFDRDIAGGSTSLLGAYQNGGHSSNLYIAELVTRLRSARNRIIDTATQTGIIDHRLAVVWFLATICELIEADYVLVPQFFDEDGEFESLGQDVAPGLTAAFKAAAGAVDDD